MPNKWLESKKDEFVTDVLKNFCLIYQQLITEFDHFLNTGSINFEVLSDLLGQEMNQGRLWRLKDTAHLLFRFFSHSSLAGHFLDWSIGSIFHECMKLKEDAYQLQNYVPWFRAVQEDVNFQYGERLIGQNLFHLVLQTKEDVRREIDRISFLLNQCLEIFIYYLPEHSENTLLARFIYDQNQIVQDVFKDHYINLLQAMYQDKPEKLYILACKSLRQGGWLKKAQSALNKANDINPENPMIYQEKKDIDITLKKR